jgi:hypothetical protein
MCLKAKAKFCAFKFSGCYARSTSLKPVTEVSFQKCYQYGMVLVPVLHAHWVAPLALTAATTSLLVWYALPANSAAQAALHTAFTDVTSGKCGSASTFECANVTKCCPGCGLNNTDVAKCDHMASASASIADIEG